MFKWFRLQSRLAELEATVQTLKNERKNIEMEWESMYEKFRLLYVRLSKRVRQADQAPEREDTQPGESDAEQTAGSPSLLSPRQREVNERILARRRKSVTM